MGSAEKPPGTPQAEAPPVETPADGSLPPVTPPKEQSGADAADDELAMRQPGFTSPLIKMGARTVEKLERVGVEAGALALPPLRDPVQCFRDAERRHARREICRRRMLLERYERHREQMLAIRHDLGVPDDDDEEAAEVIEESSEVVDGLRATVHSLRKELRRAERDHSVQSRRIDELEAVVVRKSEEARMAGERTNGATKLLRTAQKREQLYQQHESEWRAELSANSAEDRRSELGQKLQEAQLAMLRQENQISAVTRREEVLKKKVKALTAEVQREKTRIVRLLESPQKKKIQAKLEALTREDAAAAQIQAVARGDAARRQADAAMRCATKIQAEVRRKAASKALKSKTKDAVTAARQAVQKLSEVQSELNEATQKRDGVQHELDSMVEVLESSKQELAEVTERLKHTRGMLTAALTLKGRSAAQGLLSRWKEVEEINTALAAAKAEEEKLMEARRARRAAAVVSGKVSAPTCRLLALAPRLSPLCRLPRPLYWATPVRLPVPGVRHGRVPTHPGRSALWARRGPAQHAAELRRGRGHQAGG